MGKKRRRRANADGLEYVGDNGAASDGRSTRGPPVATTSGRLSGTVPNDEWQTTRKSWEAVVAHFAIWKDKRIWMPFYYDGECAAHLRALGYRNIIHTDDDFFERVKDRNFMATVDFIWDNPPYTTPETKEKVLSALASCGKPFAMLLPISILHVGFVREIFDMNQMQCIIPRRVWVKKKDGEEVPFKYLCWLCRRAGLERDLLFADDDDAD